MTAGALKTHYLIDPEYLLDKQNLFTNMGHLLVFNLGGIYDGLRLCNAALKVTLDFENNQPQTFSLEISAKTSPESKSET